MSILSTKWQKLLDNKENGEGFAGFFEIELQNEADLNALREELEKTEFEYRLGLSLIRLLSGLDISRQIFPIHSFIRMKSDEDAMLFKLSVRI